jgi:sarcosine oxidase subunit beta
VIRSNYLWDESAAIYEHSLKLWEGLAEELDYDLLFSQRGVLNLAHSPGDVRESVRRVSANRLNGIDAEWLEPEQVLEACPILDVSEDARYPVLGATYQGRGGIARHENVAWGYARAADALGVDLIQGCEVTGFDGLTLETTLGRIGAGKIGLCAAGHTSTLAALVGLRLPIQSHPLQALVSEIYEPVLPNVVMSNAVHVYVSQAHKGELVMGAGIDAYNSYGQRGGFHVIEHQLAAALELFPVFAEASVLRTWGGIVDVCPDASPIVGLTPIEGLYLNCVDVCPDASPIVGLTPIEGLYLNCGWGTGGFKATPGSGWAFAATIAAGEPHPLVEPFALERFRTGALIDEHGAAAVAH